jgi:hypothetical protein
MLSKEKQLIIVNDLNDVHGSILVILSEIDLHKKKLQELRDRVSYLYDSITLIQNDVKKD